MAVLSVRYWLFWDSNAGTWKNRRHNIIIFSIEHTDDVDFQKVEEGGGWENTGYNHMACILFILITFPWGNFLRKFSCLLVTPNWNAGSTLTSDPLYLAAMSTLYARKLFEYVYRVWKTTGWLRWVRCQRDGRDKSGYGTCTYAWRHFSACDCTFFRASIYIFMYVTWAYVDGDRSVIKERNKRNVFRWSDCADYGMFK